MQFKVRRMHVHLHPVWFLITLTAFAILIKLSWWQLDRAAEKTAQLQRQSEWQAQGPVNWSQLQRIALEDADLLEFADQGQWLSPVVWLLDNKIVDGKVGYDVVIPVQFNRFEAPILVNLGWVEGAASRAELPELEIPQQIEVQGLLRTSFANIRLGQNLEDLGRWPMRIQQIELDDLAQYLPQPAYPAVIYQLGTSPFVTHYQAVVMPPEKHRGYALQWFLLAVAVVGVALAASIRKEESDE
ncbi:MAG: SURF1 family protein [Alkalimonas sp.]|nr:SURF1 family protein [Alkalimonas sp.]